MDAGIDQSEAVTNLSKALAGASGFRVMGQRLDVYGICPRCAQASGRGRRRSSPVGPRAEIP
jgi:Fe2+ or Zn2+ uptake regulation protein